MSIDTLSVFEEFELRSYKKMIASEYADWLLNLKNWVNFLTLTFKDITPPDVARSKFNYLVQVLNRDAFGKHYVRKVGHSYFSYVLAVEYQRRGVIHFHVLTDRNINYDLLHRYWNIAAGFAWAEPVKDKCKVIAYCSKYCVKGGNVDIYESESYKTPMIGALPPYWWK